jgi:hypothetical protein
MVDKRQNKIENEELKKLIQEAITESRYKDFDLKIKEKRLERKENLWNTIITFIPMMSLIWFLYSMYDKEGPELKNHVKQIEQLDQMSQNLKGFQVFLDQQKTKISTDQQLIVELQKQKNQIEPILKTDKKAIEAILSSYEDKQNQNKLWGWILSFILGILSSVFATQIMKLDIRKINISRLTQIQNKSTLQNESD